MRMFFWNIKHSEMSSDEFRQSVLDKMKEKSNMTSYIEKYVYYIIKHIKELIDYFSIKIVK
jgi:hypothetical protein